jgi:hypothetical protein
MIYQGVTDLAVTVGTGNHPGRRTTRRTLQPLLIGERSPEGPLLSRGATV